MSTEHPPHPTMDPPPLQPAVSQPEPHGLARVVSLAETTKLRTVSGLDRFVKGVERAVSLVSKPLGVGAPGLKPPRGLKWRTSPWFLTAVVCIGVMSDLLAYVGCWVVVTNPRRLSSPFCHTTSSSWGTRTWRR